jgi:hypothetical protein
VSRRNCWEFKGCGREPGGQRVAELGICPTAVETAADGLNGGRNGGRICWAVSGHFTEDGEVRCATAKTLATCMACEFFTTVLREEGLYNIAFTRPDPPAASRGPGRLASVQVDAEIPT